MFVDKRQALSRGSRSFLLGVKALVTRTPQDWEDREHIIIFQTVKLCKPAGAGAGRGRSRRSVVMTKNSVIKADAIIQRRVSSNVETHLT